MGCGAGTTGGGVDIGGVGVVAGVGCGGGDGGSWWRRSRSSRKAASRSCCSRISRTEDARVSLSSSPIFFRSSVVGGEEVSLDPDG